MRALRAEHDAVETITVCLAYATAVLTSSDPLAALDTLPADQLTEKLARILANCGEYTNGDPYLPPDKKNEAYKIIRLLKLRSRGF